MEAGRLTMKAVEAHNGGREAHNVALKGLWKPGNFDEDPDPHPQSSEKSDPDPHSSKKLDPDPH